MQDTLGFLSLARAATYIRIVSPRARALRMILSSSRSTMSDPFSVAGTAVGITSLGIQTCQILHRYYSQFKGFHEDIDDVIRQAEGLQGILDSLRQIKERVEVDNHAPSSQLHIALKTCEEALEKLKDMADQCDATKQPDDIRAHLGRAQKRLLWPFRKETLDDLQGTLSKLQGNLVLALQCAGLDVTLRTLDNLHPTLRVIHGQASSIEEHVVHQTKTLELLHRNVTGGSVIQQQRHMVILSELRAEQSRDMAAVMSKLDLLVTSPVTLILV